MSAIHLGTVLVADDTPESLRLLADILTAEGYRVRPADGGKLALASALADPPDIIILDVQMDDLDGYEVCRRLKADARTTSVPVIFVSASRETEERVEGLELGAVDYVSKPFRREELLARVRNHVQLHRLRVDLEAQAGELEVANQRLRAEIRQRERLEEQLRAEHERQKYLATHDALTGLPNRRSFEHALVRSLARARRGKPSALLFMDVDNFKACNDMRGHAFGDDVLCEIAKELAAEVRSEEIVARMGGDEFAALVEGTDVEAAALAAERMRRRVKALSESAGVALDLSVGIALVGADSAYESVLSSADNAMYAEKARRADAGCNDCDQGESDE